MDNGGDKDKKKCQPIYFPYYSNTKVLKLPFSRKQVDNVWNKRKATKGHQQWNNCLSQATQTLPFRRFAYYIILDTNTSDRKIGHVMTGHDL